MDSTSQSALQGCVTSLRSSMQLLDSSINILDSGVSDYPRLAKVLQTTRVSATICISSLCSAPDTSCPSTSNWSPNTISQPPNPPSSPKSNPRSPPFSAALKHTSTSSSGARSLSSPKLNYRKAGCRGPRGQVTGPKVRASRVVRLRQG